MKQMKPKKKKKTGCSSDKTFGGDSLCRESLRDSSQDHEKIQCNLCYETMGYSQECFGTPKDREDKEQTTECVYKVPCASCDKTYIGETGRKLGVRLQEHRSEVESKTNRAFTRSHRSISSAESNRSALTDHAVQENHVISWSAASVIDRESDRSTRWIKEAVHIRKEGPRSMNRDEGSYQLTHTYDRFLGSTLTNRARNRKKKT